MEILETPVTVNKLKDMAENHFVDMLKAVVDIDRQLIALDAELHSDLEALLLDNGSSQSSLWGINIYPELDKDNYLEFDSMINLRPSQGNISRGVDDEKIRLKIIEVVEKWISR